jgi:hypothetical protein
MALQQLLKEIEPEKYFADAHFMTEFGSEPHQRGKIFCLIMKSCVVSSRHGGRFDPLKHKKYDAKYYFQRNTLIPMQVREIVSIPVACSSLEFVEESLRFEHEGYRVCRRLHDRIRPGWPTTTF